LPAPTHQKDLHLIVVRRDMVGFQHVHLTLDDDGTWSIALDLAAAERTGSWPTSLLKDWTGP